MKESTPIESLFFSKNDPEDRRLGEWALKSTEAQVQPQDFVLWGESDDEGISLNGGRPGAVQAPLQIRKCFYKMTPSLDQAKSVRILDLGNFPDPKIPGAQNLETKHLNSLRRAKELTHRSCRWIALGGGHDYGYPHAKGFLLGTHVPPVVLNFDAHLDVRPCPSPSRAHSGTPFRRLLEEDENKFEFFEVGIQDHCNSRTHQKWALDRGAHILHLDTIFERGLHSLLQSALDRGNRPPCFLSIDMDVFSSGFAPGCSASYPIGLNPVEFLTTLPSLFEWLDVRALGIYEVSPVLDVGDNTSKLAAQIMHRILKIWMERKEVLCL